MRENCWLDAGTRDLEAAGTLIGIAAVMNKGCQAVERENEKGVTDIVAVVVTEIAAVTEMAAVTGGAADHETESANCLVVKYYLYK